MMKRALILSTAATLLLVMASAARAQEVTEKVDRTIPIGPKGSLKLKNFEGDVRVTGTAGSDVVIHAVRRATRERLDNIKLEITASGSSVSIEANKRESGWREKNNNVVETEFEIKVPFGTELDLYTFSGRLQVTGVSGRIEAQTFSGNIEVDVASAKEIQAMDIETFSGDIRARVPNNASGRVEFSSFSGSVDSDLPISMRSGRRQNVRGEIGSGGGPTLKFHTFSGDLRILK
jgi:DUF4097 and DUF4098 domain-containing protein YvlB